MPMAAKDRPRWGRTRFHVVDVLQATGGMTPVFRWGGARLDGESLVFQSCGILKD